MNLSELAIFVSTVLLSVGAFAAVVGEVIRRSRCETIDSACCHCTRVVLTNAEEAEAELEAATSHPPSPVD